MKRKLLSLTLILALAGCTASAPDHSGDADADPIDPSRSVGNHPLVKNIADPYLIKVDDTYYVYGTTDAETGFRVFSSTDLRNFTSDGFIYKSSRKWQSGDFWAPEVYFYQEKYYLFYTARQKSSNTLKIGVAISDSPNGEFVDASDTPVFDLGFAMIDAHIFFDDDGRKYLYYSKDCSENIVEGYHTSQIYAVELEDDLLQMKGSPVLLSTPEGPLETSTGDYRWNEGPFLLKNPTSQLYYLMYSGGHYAEASYHMSYSTSTNPLGPFEKSPHNPLLQSNLEEDFSGPGHNSVWIESDGQMLLAYHTHMYRNGGPNRQLQINEMSFDDQGNLIVGQPIKQDHEES